MKSVLEIFDKLLDLLTVVAFLGMVAVLGLQIVYRYILNDPQVWAMPLSLFLFVWGIWLGGATGIRDQRQIRVEIADLIIPRKVQLVLAPMITVASAVFMGMAVYLSLEVVSLQSDAIYDTLPISRGWLFVVVPLVGSIIILQLVRVFMRQLKQFNAQEGSR